MPDIPPTTSEGMLDDEALYRQEYGEDPGGGDLESGLIADGICPWCDEEFQNVGAHAAQAHSEKWGEYRDD